MTSKQRTWKFLWMLLSCFCLSTAGRPAYAIDPRQVDDFVRLADQGSSQAEYVLGMAFLKGDGVIENEAIAKQYLNRAASQGHQEAKNQLDKMAEQSKPIIAFKPNFDTSLPSQPEINPVLKPALSKKPIAQKPPETDKQGGGKIHLLQIFEMFFVLGCFLFSLQTVRWFVSLFLPKKRNPSKGQSQGNAKSSYKIITDFKGRL